MFTGSYEHSVDGKGRIIIPSKYREELGDTFIVTKGIDGCLLIYPMNTWEDFVSDLSKLPGNKMEGRMIQRYFLASATEVELDKQGRALINASLRDFAGIGKNIVLAGLINKIEIWDKDKWDANVSDKDMDKMAEQMLEYNIRF